MVYQKRHSNCIFTCHTVFVVNALCVHCVIHWSKTNIWEPLAWWKVHADFTTFQADFLF